MTWIEPVSHGVWACCLGASVHRYCLSAFAQMRWAADLGVFQLHLQNEWVWG